MSIWGDLKRSQRKRSLPRVRNKPLKNRLGLLLSLIISLLFFGGLAFLKFDSSFSNTNLFWQFYKLNFVYFQKHWYYLLIVFLVSTLIILVTYIRKVKKQLWTRVAPSSLLLAFLSMIIGLNLSLIILWLVAFLTINFAGIGLKINPNMIGLVTNSDQIVARIKSSNNIPNIVETNYQNMDSQVVKIIIHQTVAGDFFNKSVINSIPQFLTIKPNLPKYSLIMFNNSLLISELKIDDLQKLSPMVGNLLLTKEFGSRYLKNPPMIDVLGRQDYLKMRDDQIDSELQTIDNVNAELQSEIDIAYQTVSTDNYKIQTNSSGLSSSIENKNNDYAGCTSMGYYDYYSGTFINYYDSSYCSTKASLDWDTIISQFQTNINDWSDQLQSDQSDLSYLNNIKKAVANYRIIVASQKDSTPFELGIFTSPDKIDIALDWVNAKSVFAFLETLSHEYLHYTSYVSTERTLPKFFEEGLTEYYARKTIKDDLGKEENIGYPLIEIVINEMFKKLPQNEMQDIYFSKDQASLTGLLDSTYGKNFYENNSVSFAILPLLPDTDGIKIANQIMKKIGGNQIKESDIVDSISGNY